MLEGGFMRSLFHPEVHDRLVAESVRFDLDQLEKEHGSWGNQFFGKSFAMGTASTLSPRVAREYK